ncbi:MAG: hypothetical protein IH604_01795 [Burkholderiales bacterium]|nr:hypothetical protein [Burkholderiales bacterium]
MTQEKRVLCTDCDREKQLMEAAGDIRVLSCKPDPEDPRFCKLEYEYTFAAGAQGDAGDRGA